MKKAASKDYVEMIVAIAITVIFLGYGWHVALENSVSTQIGVKGTVYRAHLTGAGAYWVASGAFLASAAVSFFAVKSSGLDRSVALFIAAIVLIHPLPYFVAQHL